MNRYPVWKYAIIVVALLVGCSTPCPISSARRRRAGVLGQASVKVDATTQPRSSRRWRQAGMKPRGCHPGRRSVKVRLDSTDAQLKAKDAIQKALVPDPTTPLRGGAEPAVAARPSG
jgi:preprotein translocase subunit SecD